MKDELVKFEVAKLAKEKGFNEATSVYYCTDGEVNGTKMGMGGLPNNFHGYAAPTQSLLQRWLREVHDIHVKVIWIDVLTAIYVYKILTTNNATIPDSMFYHSYEEALEEGLLTTLKLIK